jgi:CBS domain-containing protein
MSLLRLARKPPATVGPKATVAEAIELMIERHVGALAVVEGERLEGIFTERDVVKKIVHEKRDPQSTPIADVMTRDVKSVAESTPISDAMTIMSVNRIRHLPVVDADGAIKGMISLRFLMHEQLENLFTELRSLESYMMADGPGG